MTFALTLSAPALAQDDSASVPASPFAGMFTRWSGVNREELEAEAAAARRAQAEAAAESQTSTPAMARRRGEAVALGARVGQIVRDGDCEEGERVARQAGDFALVQAVRDHCRPRRTPNG